MNDSLYILKIDLMVDNIQKIEYELYYNFSTNHLTKLNLTVCKDIKIDILIPKDIPINLLDKYNQSSGFYNDICYTLTSDNGLDEPLEDRRNDYKNNNLSICEENCDFTYYNVTTKKVKCSCPTKVTLPLISEIKIDKKKLFSNFKDINNIGNFKMLSCIKQFFNTKNMLKNLSNYMFIILFILNINSILIFLFYDYKKIQEFIINIEKKNIKRKMIEKMMTINDKKNQINKLYNNSNIIRSALNIKNMNKKKIKKKTKKGIKLKKKINKNHKITDNSNEILEANEKNININNESILIEEKFEILTDYELN